MSYCSENNFPEGTRIADVREFLLLLGYRKTSGWISSGGISFESYNWYNETDYRSWSGIELSIDKTKTGHLSVSTRTPISRSYYDLEQQNLTVSALRKRFGGAFRTDEGQGRYMRTSSERECKSIEDLFLR
jgi:hypothetical protein